MLLPVGLVFLILGFGAFHEDAPWTWVHAHVPMFQSQHVPSRFLYVSLFVLALVAAMGWDRIVDRLSRKHPWLDAALLAALGLLALDISKVAQQPMTQSMWMEAPAIQEHSEFSFAKEPPYQYKKRDWAGPLYLAMLGNTGVLNCYRTPPFERKGALAQNDPRYRGEAELSGQGTAILTDWTPNHASFRVEGAGADDLLIYNMNYDEGWSVELTTADGKRDVEPENRENRVAVRLSPGTVGVRLTYTPRWLGQGLALGALGLGVCALLFRKERAR